jgi:hypothetical protein
VEGLLAAVKILRLKGLTHSFQRDEHFELSFDENLKPELLIPSRLFSVDRIERERIRPCIFRNSLAPLESIAQEKLSDAFFAFGLRYPQLG